MEDKLKELKENFCKFYCQYKNNPLTLKNNNYSDGDYVVCDECGEATWHYYDLVAGAEIYPCEYCQVDEYIRFIRDDVK